ncbi:MAG TPA: glycosyltransferase family 9 protein [Ignavibacteria bacterium]|nr:glycosyltransferase family 9 protein [Ignavibacteria bacterium]
MKTIKIEPKNVLVSRTDNIGDVILTLPLVSEIKRIFPDVKLTFLVKHNLKDLLDGYKGIDELMFADVYASEDEMQKEIAIRKFDTAFAVYPRLPLAFAFFKSGIEYRIGTAFRWYSFLFNIKIKEHRKYAIKHEYQYNLGLLRAITKKVSDNAVFYFKYTEQEKQALIIKLRDSGIDMTSDYIIVHPGSRASAKDLPLENLTGAVVKMLDEIPYKNIFLTGLQEENEILNKIIDNIQGVNRQRIFSLGGMLTLRELMILIDNCKVFMSNSTGPIHIAGALNKNIVGFYPETPPIGPIRWKPLSDNSIILTPVDSYDSMSSIKPEKIVEAVKNFL